MLTPKRSDKPLRKTTFLYLEADVSCVVLTVPDVT